MAGRAVARGKGAVHDVVVDRVGLDLTVDAHIFQPQAFQPACDQRLLGLGIQHQFGRSQLPIAIRIKG